ncbi:DASS family sodium-coupled anion symporter [Campylobacter sp. MIT 97-5078]|uniref:DASS family sodium-coupled anion symporter n=1 Tax=Campylobacter sp. MIT 97-5078 TaxID=1548153 RepID=UPI0005143D90|nr:DASS family sodium-coupled anion symporter [Campylobacter sp. MIT 97-5078]KGI55723.1 citrate:succinate antiporter [Campylobacter sp. MIT 97-5078]TQR27159.1 anion permease [Campylobacter sp. MIT 97-5078]
MSYAKLLAPIVIGVFVYFSHYLFTLPDGLSLNAWLYLSIFVGLIIGLILEPIAPALIGVIAITLAVLFKVGPVGSGDTQAIIKDSAAIKWGLAGFSDSVVWLIFAAFTIGLGFSKTGLGERIALYLVSKLGKSTLGLGYAIAIVDLILAPFIPSNAARSGGTVYPIVNSIAPMFESYADKNPRKIGAYLIWIGLASCCVSSSIFLTGQAPNPLALSLISKSNVAVVDWLSWFLAFLPVGIILFILTPLLGYFIYPPEVRGSKEIALWAEDKYKALGTMPKTQIFMLIIALIGLILWVGASFFQINATTTALIMIILMIACKVITWQDFLANKPAWNTLVWFATLVTMAGGLKNVGFLDYLANALGHQLTGFKPFIAMILLLMLFSWLRYFFASGTAYVTAIVAIFVSLASSIPDANPAQIMLILVLPMGFMGVITPYGTGCSPLWFGSNYIKGPQFFLLGGVFALIYMIIYLLVGIPWVEFISPYLSFH